MWGELQDYAELISEEWLVGALLLFSMTLQIVLVVLGAHRYHCSQAFFRLVVWGAYISADAVAISALGTMTHSCTWSGIYGIWAPVLLLHLGGPDAITAYSRADNELWLRHGFNMVYQVSVAVYIICSSALKGHALASSILLLVAGTTKYGERTLALWLASDSQIVTSCLPICKYLEQKNVVEDRGYVVMGEKELQKIIEANLEPSSTEGSSNMQPQAEIGRDTEAGLDAESMIKRGIVTIEDISNADIEKRDCTLCLSHALFKMYMRRFVSLQFEEGDWTETRAFWVKFTGNAAFKIVEMELKFMYDVLFSKGNGTAFSSFGMVLRILNSVLIGAAAFMILREIKESKTQQMVTCVVTSAALVVEVLQLCQIMASNWTRVRLICAQVGEITHPLSNVIKVYLLALGKVQNLVGGDGYRSNKIHQYCLVGSCQKRYRSLWNIVKFFPKANSYISSWQIYKVPFQEDLKDFIFNILRQKCSPRDDSETCRDAIYYFEEDLFEEDPEIKGFMSSHENLEKVILVWHIATTICHSDRQSCQIIDNETKNVQWSIILSRYCAYLLVSYPRLLPVHPDMARITYMKLVEQVMCKIKNGQIPRDIFNCSDSSVLGSGAKLAGKLKAKGENVTWKLLAEYWARLLIYMAVYNKATFHAECVAAGGEFLSQVWVLVGHMGYGEQSDSAVRMKIESSKEGERRERRRIKERKIVEQQRMEDLQRQMDTLEQKRKHLFQELESRETNPEERQCWAVEWQSANQEWEKLNLELVLVSRTLKGLG